MRMSVACVFKRHCEVLTRCAHNDSKTGLNNALDERNLSHYTIHFYTCQVKFKKYLFFMRLRFRAAMAPLQIPLSERGVDAIADGVFD